MSNDLQLFNSHGLLNEPLDVKQVAKIPDEDQQVLAEILPVIRDGEAQDRLVIETRTELYKAVELENLAVEEDQRVNLAISPVEATRQWIAAQNNQPAPKKRPIDKKVRAAKEASSLSVIALRQEFNQQLKRQREVTSPAKAAAIIRWVKVQAPPAGRELAQARDYQDRSQADRTARKLATGSAEIPVPPQPPRLKHRGYSGSTKVGPPLGHKF